MLDAIGASPHTYVCMTIKGYIALLEDLIKRRLWFLVIWQIIQTMKDRLLSLETVYSHWLRIIVIILGAWWPYLLCHNRMSRCLATLPWNHPTFESTLFTKPNGLFLRLVLSYKL